MNNYGMNRGGCGRRVSEGEPRREAGGCGCGRPTNAGGCSNRIHARRDNQGQCNQGCGAQKQCVRMMRRLQQLDFAIQELILYLDVYPECSRALEQFHRLRCEREQLMQEYREQCAPVCATDNVSGEHWDWISAPWPWQNDFVGNDKGQL